MTDKKIVWILGAGFSRPLGGPLLTDLFSVSQFEGLAACYPNNHQKLFGGQAKAIHGLYHAGLVGPFNGYVASIEGITTQRIWGNAEEFLDYLDTAATNPPSTASKRIIPILAAVEKNVREQSKGAVQGPPFSLAN